MVQIIQLENLRANNPERTLRVRLTFANEAGKHTLLLNGHAGWPFDPDGVPDQFLAACGRFQEPPGLRRWHDVPAHLAQELLQSAEHEQALQYLADFGVPRPLPTLFEAAAVEFLALRELEQLMLASRPALREVIFRMVRAGCRDVSKRLTTRLVNHPEFTVWYTPSTCPDHAPKGRRICEHCVPLSPIHERILAKPGARSVHCREQHGHLEGIAEIAAFLASQFTVAFVTADDNKKLLPTNRMPDTWNWDSVDKMERYKGLEPVPHFPRTLGQTCTSCQVGTRRPPLDSPNATNPAPVGVSTPEHVIA